MTQTDRQFLDACREQRKTLGAEYAEVTKQKQAILSREEHVTNALKGIDMLIAELESRAGITGASARTEQEPQKSVSVDVPITGVSATATTGTVEAGEFSPTWFVRDFILVHATNGGASPAAIKKAAGAHGTRSSFPYTVLNRLKSRGETRRVRGHYYPTDKMPKDRSAEDSGEDLFN